MLLLLSVTLYVVYAVGMNAHTLLLEMFRWVSCLSLDSLIASVTAAASSKQLSFNCSDTIDLSTTAVSPTHVQNRKRHDTSAHSSRLHATMYTTTSQ
jgi:hypothetical protein